MSFINLFPLLLTLIFTRYTAAQRQVEVICARNVCPILVPYSTTAQPNIGFYYCPDTYVPATDTFFMGATINTGTSTNAPACHREMYNSVDSILSFFSTAMGCKYTSKGYAGTVLDFSAVQYRVLGAQMGFFDNRVVKPNAGCLQTDQSAPIVNPIASSAVVVSSAAVIVPSSLPSMLVSTLTSSLSASAVPPAPSSIITPPSAIIVPPASIIPVPSEPIPSAISTVQGPTCPASDGQTFQTTFRASTFKIICPSNNLRARNMLHSRQFLGGPSFIECIEGCETAGDCLSVTYNSRTGDCTRLPCTVTTSISPLWSAVLLSMAGGPVSPVACSTGESGQQTGNVDFTSNLTFDVNVDACRGPRGSQKCRATNSKI